jgi:hypothetical protein
MAVGAVVTSRGRRAITGDTALRLAHFFGTSAEFWLNLQGLYELRVARKKVGKSIKALPRLTPAALRTEEYFRERASRGDAGQAKRILKRAGRGKAAVAGDGR